MVLGLQINKETVGDTLTVHIKDDLNVKTSPYLEDELTKSISGVKNLILDFANVEYISSTGFTRLACHGKIYAPSARRQ